MKKVGYVVETVVTTKEDNEIVINYGCDNYWFNDYEEAVKMFNCLDHGSKGYGTLLTKVYYDDEDEATLEELEETGYVNPYDCKLGYEELKARLY